MTSPAGFDEFYVGAYSRVVRFVRPLVASLDEAEDVTQESFARAFTRWARIEDFDAPEAWVKRVAVNLAISRFRRLRVAARHLLQHRPEPIAIDETATSDIRLDLQRALATIPAKQRAVLIMHYLDDTAIRDIAIALGSSEGSVKTNLTRARRSLAKSLEGGAS